jgi:hypothetical protein
MTVTEFQTDTPEDDISLDMLDGQVSTVAIVDATAEIEPAYTPEQWDSVVASWNATVGQSQPPATVAFLQSVVDPVTDAVNDGIVPANQAPNFYFWLTYNMQVTFIPTDGTYLFLSPYVMKWAQDNGWATMGPNPLPTPVVQQLIQSAAASQPTTGPAPTPVVGQAPQSANAAVPLPGAQVAPVTIPTPTPGQQATVAASSGVTSSTVTGGINEGTSAAQVSAALAVTAVNVLEVVARVFDAFLPGMAPGQVPEALRQLNTAANALEHQMAEVRDGVWPRNFQNVTNLAESIAGSLQAIQGEVLALQQQMATKAESTLGDDVNANTTAIAGVAGTVGTLAGVTVPALATGLQSLTSTVGSLDSQVQDQIAPELTATKAATDANTQMLSGTDQECLDELCDAETNVTTPIKQGGATPSLLGQLGNMLQKAFEIGVLASILDAIFTVLDAKVALAAVAQDTEMIAGWATSAATIIEQDLTWGGAVLIERS